MQCLVIQKYRNAVHIADNSQKCYANPIINIKYLYKKTIILNILVMMTIRAPSRSRKLLRLASRLKPTSRGFYGGGVSYGGLRRLMADWRIICIINYSHMLATPLILLICNI